jgi:hypothetical protein
MFVEGRKPSAVRYKQSQGEALPWTKWAIIFGKTCFWLIPYDLELMAPGGAGPRPQCRAILFGSGSAGLGEKDIELSSFERGSTRGARSRQEHQQGEVERIVNALGTCGWNVSQAATVLGIPRSTLYRKLKRYGLTVGKPRRRRTG